MQIYTNEEKTYKNTKALILYMKLYKLEDIPGLGEKMVSVVLSELERIGVTEEYISEIELGYPQDLDVDKLGLLEMHVDRLKRSGIATLEQLLEYNQIHQHYFNTIF